MAGSIIGNTSGTITKDGDGKKCVRVCVTDQPIEVNVVSGGGGSTQEQINGVVSPAFSTVTVTPTSGNITALIIQNPLKGPNENGDNKVLLLSWDGGATYFSIPKGGAYTAEGISEASVTISADRNNTKFEIILEHD